jgi:hypothetical protein
MAGRNVRLFRYGAMANQAQPQHQAKANGKNLVDAQAHGLGWE